MSLPGARAESSGCPQSGEEPQDVFAHRLPNQPGALGVHSAGAERSKRLVSILSPHATAEEQPRCRRAG